MNTPCIEAPGSRYNGYGKLRQGGKQVYAHRVAYCKAVGLSLSDIADVVVRHRCDNRGCINPEHLETGSKADNSADMVERGRSAAGERHPGVKLSDKDVVSIRSLYVPKSKDANLQCLADRFGVSMQRISQLIKGEGTR